MIIKEFIKSFEELYPKRLAATWDNVGLQLGYDQDVLNGVLLSLDLTDEVLDEAIKINANLVIVHHPMIFKPLKEIDYSTYQGRLIHKAIKNDLNIYVAHTNFDSSNFGMNLILANMIGIQITDILEYETESEGLGRVGNLEKPMSLSSFTKHLKRSLDLDSVRLISNMNLDEMIQSVAIVGGSGGHIIHTGLLKNVDVYVTGDIKYHDALDAINQGYTVIDVGHHVEKKSLPKLQEVISKFNTDIKVTVSEIDTNPYKKI